MRVEPVADLESASPTRRWRRCVRAFLGDDSGTTSIEYGLIACLVCIGALAGLQALANGTSGGWMSVSNKVSNAMGP